MMKKLFIGCLLVALAFLGVHFAVADTERQASFKGVTTTVTCDASSGICVEVDADGNFLTTEGGKKTVSYGAGDRQVKASAGRVYAVLASSSSGAVTAGDRVVIKNGTDATGSPLILMEFSGTRGTVSFTPSVGLNFDTGIYVDETLSGGGAVTSVVYE